MYLEWESIFIDNIASWKDDTIKIQIKEDSLSFMKDSLKELIEFSNKTYEERNKRLILSFCGWKKLN